MIYGKVGRLGHGKTMRGTVESIELCKLRGGLDDPPRCWLASNIRVNVPAGMVFRQLSMDAFSEAVASLLDEARALHVGVVVFVDEVDEVWDSHHWQQMSREDRHRIKQSRHYGADLIWTAQFVDQVEKSIRNITEEVELLRAVPNPTIARREHRRKDGTPAPRRPWFIRGKTYRPAAMRELGHDDDRQKRIRARWLRYRQEHELLYDTDEIIVAPVRPELCSKHKREAVELLCPECSPPPERHVDPLLAFAESDPIERLPA